MAFDSPDIIDQLFLKKVRNNEMDPKDPGCGNRFVLPLPKDKMVSRKRTHSYKDVSWEDSNQCSV